LAARGGGAFAAPNGADGHPRERFLIVEACESVSARAGRDQKTTLYIFSRTAMLLPVFRHILS
jgi:hypothetical protein